MIITLSFVCKLVLFLALSIIYLAIVVGGPKKDDDVETVIAGMLIYTFIFSVLLTCLYWA